MPIEVYKLNPKGVKHQLESTLKRTITDSVSAEGIANYLANNLYVCFFIQTNIVMLATEGDCVLAL
jgi:hypothetical protein